MLVVSVLEGLYIIYMFIFFKTCYSLEIGRWEGAPITTFFSEQLKFNVEKLLYHPIKNVWNRIVNLFIWEICGGSYLCVLGNETFLRGFEKD